MTKYYRAMYKPSANAGGNLDNTTYSAWVTDPAQVFSFTSVTAGNKIVGGMWWDDTVYDVPNPPSAPALVSLLGMNGDGNLDSSKTYTLPTLESGQKAAIFVVAAAASTGAGGALTVPAYWNYVNLANDGEATDRGKTGLYTYTYAEWVAAGSPATATVTSASSCYMCAGAVVWEPITGTVEVVFATGADPSSISPAAGLGAYLFVTAFVRTRNDSVISTAPSGYSSLTSANTGGTAANDTKMRTLHMAAKEVASASSEDPGTAGTGSPAGAARQAIVVALG